MAATSTLQDKVFDFFRLPRELRDLIYAGLTCEIIIQGKKPYIQRAVVQNAPIEKLLTLNKQFNHEYDQHVREASRMLIEDGITMNGNRIPLGRRARELKRVEIRLLMFANKMDRALEELTDQEDYNLCIGHSGEWLEGWQEDPFRAPLETFINHSGVSTLKIRRVQQVEEATEDNAEALQILRKAMGDPRQSLATWTKEWGWKSDEATEAKDTD
ncbi:hypothetical protein LTS10_009848 [Elasticomyces elasticus]|nr:hypothetical protein LTS10_009848 [Elasticomyces elasticus]